MTTYYEMITEDDNVEVIYDVLWTKNYVYGASRLAFE